MTNLTVFEAERNLIGGIICAGSSADARDLVPPDCISEPFLRKAYEAIIVVEDSGQPVTPVSVADAIGADVKADAELLESMAITGAFVQDYARKLAKLNKRVRIAAAGKELQVIAKKRGDLDAELDSFVGRLADLSRNASHQDAVGVGSAMIDAVSAAQEATEGVATGYPDLDSILGKLRKGQSIVLAARPGIGKSALAMNIAANVIREKVAVVFSLEMSARELTYRVIASEANCDGARMIRGRMSPAEWSHIMDVCNRVQPMFERLRVVDRSALTPAMVRGHLRRESLRHEIGLVVVDYMQLMASGHKRESQNVEVSQISRAMKNMARDFDVPILSLSQLSRGIETRSDQRPKLSDLRDSGAIEQDADVVLFIHRPDNSDSAQIIVAKQRNGPQGVCNLNWNGRSMKFESRQG